MVSLKSLRAYAISLTLDIHQAEDLVQETVLKAISKQEKFEAGTNLRARPFTILRNLYFSGRHTKQREALLLIDGEGRRTTKLPDPLGPRSGRSRAGSTGRGPAWLS